MVNWIIKEKMEKPNFLIFMTDHQRGDTLFEDHQIIKPNVDAFRQDSMNFTSATCPSPHCCPSRATFFTGLYPSEHGVWNNVGVSNSLSKGLFKGVKCFSEDMKENGYDLYFSGKWHVSAEEGPQDKGFENIYHTTQAYKQHEHVPNAKEWHHYESAESIEQGGEERAESQIIREGYTKYYQYGINENPFGDSDVVEAAVKKINELKGGENPFLLYVGTLGPHDPYCIPQRFLDMYQDMEIELPESFWDTLEDKPALYRRTRANYSQLTKEEHIESMRRFYAFCTYEDYLFGQMIDALKENDLYKDTIVLYVSDHGDYIGSHGLWAKGLPCFKEAYHVCSMIGGGYFVDHFKGNSESAEMVNLADFAPTFLELAGITVDRKFAGKSIVPLLKGDNEEAFRTEQYTQSNGNEVYGIQRSVTTKKWKYVFNSFDFDELYNLEEDPHEMKNLIYTERPQDTEYAPIVRKLCKKMWQFAYERQDNCVNPYIMTAMAPYGPGIIKGDKSERKW